MALDLNTVNAAYLATLGRPAEGKAYEWASVSATSNDLLTNITTALGGADFVEYLYTNILGRPSDAEGKAFWSAVYAANGAGATLAQFYQTIIAAGAADPSNADYQSFIATSKTWVKILYKNLLGDENPDQEGIDFWTNALVNGVSQGDLLASFMQAAASNPSSDHAQTLNAKLVVANAITSAFNDYNSTLSADEKKAGETKLIEMMSSVTAGTTVEDVKEQIDQFVGNNQNLTTTVFTKDTDTLEGSQTAATIFQGTVNLVNPDNSTATSDDSATGSSDYTNTLKINVVSDENHNILSLTDLPQTTNVQKLEVNNGTAKVTGELDGTKYQNSAVFNGTGDVELEITGTQKALSVGTGAKGESIITVNAGGDLQNYTGGAGADSTTVRTNAKIGNVTTNGGKDEVNINAGATIKENSTISLGAGDDSLTIGANVTKNADEKSTITLDGGNGTNDTLDLGGNDVTGVKTITGFESLKANGATVSAIAANGLKTTLNHGGNLTVEADKAVRTIDLKNISVANNNAAGSANINITEVTNETIVLSGTDKNISETVTLKAAGVKATYMAHITNFAKGKYGIAGDKINFNGLVSNVTIIDTTANQAIKDAVEGYDLAQTTGAIKAIEAFEDAGGTVNDNDAVVVSKGGVSVIWKCVRSEPELVRHLVTVEAPFTTGDENTYFDVNGSGGGTGADVDYNDLPGDTSKKTFTDGGTYGGKTIDVLKAENKTVNIKAVNGALDIKGKDTGTHDYSQAVINVEASGDVNFPIKCGTVSAAGPARAKTVLKLDDGRELGGSSAAALTNVDVIQLNGTNTVALNQLNGKTIALGATAGTDSATVNATGAGAKVSFANINKVGSNDVNITIKALAQDLDLSTTGTKDTVDLAAGISGKTIANYVVADDQLNIKNITKATSVTTVTKGTTDFAKDSVFFTGDEDLGTVSSTVTDKIVALFKDKAAATFATGKKALLVSTNGTDTKIYEITGNATAGLDTGDSIALLATVSGVKLTAADFEFNTIA